MKPKKDSFDKWFDKTVIVMNDGKVLPKNKIHNMLKEKVKEKLIKQVKKENK
jgi:hypothetical protein